MSHRLHRLGPIAALLAALIGPALAPTVATAAGGATIKVVVNGEPITSTEIAERARLLTLTSHMASASLERTATEELIDEKLKFQEGKRVGTEISDQQVDQAFASIAARLKITPAQLAAGLGTKGVTAANLKNRLRGQILWQQLVVGRFNRSVNISDQQIVDALAKKQPGTSKEAAASATNNGTTAEYTLQQVIMAVPQGSNADARMREAEALRAKVTSCEGMVEAVRSINEAVVKPLGKRTEDELPENFRGALAEVPVGHMTKPFRTPAGIEMAAVCAKRELKGDFQIRSKVEEELRAEEGEVFARRYILDLRRTAVIDYRK